ncbi:MAG: hypothetical protein RLZZ393_952 [Pseudomonadota bacterium]|jgi:hypothetical protein
MAKAKKTPAKKSASKVARKAAKKTAKPAVIPPHPPVPTAKEIGELCADVYRYAVKLGREEGMDEQAVEQLAFGEVREFMAACIRQSKDDWKAYTKATGVHSAYVEARKPARKAAKKK